MDNIKKETTDAILKNHGIIKKRIRLNQFKKYLTKTETYN
jgi:hypothetical protein